MEGNRRYLGDAILIAGQSRNFQAADDFSVEIKNFINACTCATQVHAAISPAKPIESAVDTSRRDSDERGRGESSPLDHPETFRTSRRMLRRSHKPSPWSPLGVSVGVRCVHRCRASDRGEYTREGNGGNFGNQLSYPPPIYWLESPSWLRSRSPAPTGPVDAAMFETAILVISTSQRALGGSLSSLSSNGFVFVTVISVA
jgi:hypothetical protein